MNNPNSDKNAPAGSSRFQLSKSLTIRSKVPGRGPPNPSVPPPQSQAEKAAQPPRATSEDTKRKFLPNVKNARKKDRIGQSNDGMEEEVELTQKKKPVLSKNNLLFKPKEESNNKNNRGWAGHRISTSDSRAVAFGGAGGSITNYDKSTKQKKDLFNTNLADEDIYKNRKFLFPVEVKINAEKESVTNGDMLVETETKTKELTHEKEITNALLNEFCFFQMPANLPLEGCYEMTPKTENADIEINSNDLLSSYLNNKFDSTGFYLERDFRFLQGKSKDKMTEENPPQKGKEAGGFKDKPQQEKSHDTYHIGKLCRMKNGDLKLRIGNNFFDLTQGVQDSFYKELYAIDYSDQVAMSLFPIEKKFIIKPDMESFY